MGFLMRLFSAHRMRSQRHVAERAAHVIEHVIFEMGVDRLLEGTVQLDRDCRPHFFGGQRRLPPARALASVALAPLAESAALGRATDHAGTDPHALRACISALVARLLDEFNRQSARYRALPATRGA